METNRKSASVIIGIICTAFIALRFWDLTSSCLWFDEIFSVHAAEHTYGGLIWFVAQDLIHPPLFYALLKIWIAVGGEGLFWLRLFPVLFSVLALVPFLLLTRELKLKFQTVALALGFFAVNGALIKYAQEVRMYSLLLFFSLISMWLFARFFYKGKNIWILTLVNILLVYTHYFGWLVIGSEIIAILVFQRIKIRHVLIMLAIAAVSYIPWIWFLWQAVGAGSTVNQNIGWIAKPGFILIFDFILDVVEPFYFQQSTGDPASLLYISIPLLIIIGAAKIAYYIDWKLEEDKSRSYFLTVFAIVPVLFALMASWLLPVSIWGSRHLIIVFAPMMIISAIFISEIKMKAFRFVLVTAMLLIVAAAFVIRLRAERPEYAWCAMEKLANEWNTAPHRSPEPKTVYVFEDLAAYHLWFALRNYENAKVILVKGTGVPEDMAYFLPRGFDDVEVINENEIAGEWVSAAFRADEMDVTKPPVSNLISRGYEIVELVPFPVGASKAYLVRARKTK